MAAGAAQGLGEGRGGRGFLGPRVPAEVEAMSRGVQDVGKETFRRLLNEYQKISLWTFPV